MRHRSIVRTRSHSFLVTVCNRICCQKRTLLRMLPRKRHCAGCERSHMAAKASGSTESSEIVWDVAGTSGLSAHLHFGMISARTAVAHARKAVAEAPTKNAAASARSWLNELVWREFFQAAIYHFPHSLNRSLRPEFELIEWLESRRRHHGLADQQHRIPDRRCCDEAAQRRRLDAQPASHDRGIVPCQRPAG